VVKEEEPKEEDKEDKAKEDGADGEEKNEVGEDTPRAVSPEPTDDAPKEEPAKAEEEPKAAEEESKVAKKEPTPVAVSESKEPESLGFGFVNFLDHESAAAAVKALHEKEYTVTEDGETIAKVLFVGRAQKKVERERELRTKYESEKMDRIAKFQGVNLYVKNLDDGVSDDDLRNEFAAMGTITSARVMRDHKTGISRGFGFVCFSTPDDSTRAVNEMNGKIISGKPIFVALAQRRDVRRAQLEAQHNQGRNGPNNGGGGGQPGAPGQPGMMRGPMGGPMGGYPGAVPMYMPGPGRPGGMQPSYPVGVPQMMGGGGGRGGYPMGGPGGHPRPGGYPMQGYGMMPAQPGRGGRGGAMGRGGRGPHQGGRGGAPGPYGRGPGRGGPAPIKFSQQARNAAGPPQGGPAGGMPPGGAPGGPPAPRPNDAAGASAPPAPGGPGAAPGPPVAAEQLTPAALASASPEIQKNMIGERLYPLIHQTQPELAGKITGMLLEMDNSELLHLLESPEALGSKIHEALQVLEAHNANGDK